MIIQVASAAVCIGDLWSIKAIGCDELRITAGGIPSDWTQVIIPMTLVTLVSEGLNHILFAVKGISIRYLATTLL